MQSSNPDPNALHTVFSGCYITGPVIQTVNTDAGTVIYNFRGPDEDELEAAHNEIRGRTSIANGTGSWLYASTADSPAADLFRQFRDDLDLDNATLLCSAYPLVGKTILANVLKQHLANLRISFPHPSGTAVSALYLGHHRMKGKFFRDIRLQLLKNLAWQCRGSGPHHRAFDKISELISRQMSPPDDVVLECFTTICQSLQVFYIVVDAMDECAYSERQQLMQFLKDLQCKHGAKIRLFITCRPLEEIADAFSGCKSLQLQAHDDDIARFVEQQIHKSETIDRWDKQYPELRLLSSITSAVLQAAGRQFFIAEEHMKILTAQLTLGSLQETIQKLPHLTPSNIYRARVERIRDMSTKDRDVGLQILMWVFYLRQPAIELRTLQYALAISRDASEPPPEKDFLNAREIVRLTEGFVKVDKSGTVSGCHQTAYTYFNAIRWLDFPDAADLIVSRSARHLTFYKTSFRSDTAFLHHGFTDLAMAEIHHQIDVVEGHPRFKSLDGQAVVEVQMQSSLRSMSSTLYSCADAVSSRSTLKYIMKVALSRNLLSQLSEVAKDDSMRKFYFSHAPVVHQLYGTEQRHQPLVMMTETPLHLAAVLRCQVLSEKLLNDSIPVDNLNHHGDTALTIAMKLGCERVVRVLLEKGAMFDLEIPSGWEVLLHTIAQDHSDMAQQALEQAAGRAKKKSMFSRNSKKTSGVLLLKSVYDGHADLSDALRKCKKHPSLTKLLGTALLVAADQQHDQIIDQLLARIDNKDMNVDYSDRAGNTALHRAARRNNEQMVAHLLDKGATANIKNRAGHTPWHTISHLPSHIHISQMLIRKGADPDTRDREGVSNLYTSAAGGHVVAMRLILQAGTDPGIRTIYGWSPLHWAAGNGHLDATRLLLEWERSEDGKKADINCLSDTTETPLDRALIWNHTAVIELLREHGALTGREVCGLPGHSSSLYRSYPDSELTSWLEADEEEFDRLFRTYFEALTIDQEVERTFARQTRGNFIWKRFFTPSRRRSPHSPLTSPLPPLSRPNSSDASAQYFDSDSNNEGDARDLS